MNITDTLQSIENNEFTKVFSELYGTGDDTMTYQKQRYLDSVSSFAKLYPNRKDIRIFSASGRTEIGGNHTDHQHGCVLAAAVNLDAIGVVAFHNDGVIRIKSEGYDPFTVNLSDISVQSGNTGTAAIVSGIATRFMDMGVKIGGFDLYCTSDVIGGSGISSSAAFETLIGTIIDTYYNDNKAGAVEIAKIGQFAENVYFGKNSGLMDQMACSVGNIIAIDFKDPSEPVIERIDCRFEDYGYALCIIDTHTEHADLTADYAAIPADMKKIAAHFGKEVLRDVDPSEFDDNKTKLKVLYGDRAVKRAEHFFAENERAGLLAEALKAGDFNEYLKLVNESARSSEELLQNTVPQSDPSATHYRDCIDLARKVLDGRGAARVHGGGFAGTIQAYVPLEEKENFRKEMEKALGKGSCHYLSVSR